VNLYSSYIMQSVQNT